MNGKISDKVQYLCPIADCIDSVDYEDDFTHILSRDELIVQQNHICSVVGAPTTVIQFYQLKDGNWDRIDSQLSSISLRSSCHTLRTCAAGGEELCKRCDSLHAGLFEGLHKKSISHELQKKLNGKLRFLREEYSFDEYLPEICESRGRVYLTYGCPILGYREHVFPIFYKDAVIGVLFLGQIKLKSTKGDELRRIKEAKERFFANNPQVFDDYVNMAHARPSFQYPKKYSVREIQKYILGTSVRAVQPRYIPFKQMTQDMYNPRIPDILSPVEYSQLLERVFERLSSFEDYLDKRMTLKREDFLRKTIDKAVIQFRQSDSTTPYDDLFGLWKNVDGLLDYVVQECGLQAISIFSSNSISQKNDNLLRLVARRESTEVRGLPKAIKVAHCEIKGFLDLPNKPIDTDEAPWLLSALPASLISNAERCYALLLPVKRIPSASVFLLFEFVSSDIKKSISPMVANALINFFALISSRLSELFENATQQYLERILRMYKHEINHLTSGMVRPISYLRKAKIQNTDEKKLNDVYNDAAGTLNMLAFMEENIETLLERNIEPVPENVQMSHRILYKWENIFREEAHKKQSEFFFKRSKAEVHTDPRYAELVVYNLFSNAVKYSYRGAKIYFDCAEIFPGSNRFVFSIVNYSFNIPSENLDELFSFGYRYRGPRRDDNDGSGIGLFVVAQVIEKLGGSIQVKEPRPISDYNIPMLHAYIQSPQSKKRPEYPFAIKAYERLKSMTIVDPLGEEVDGLDLVISDTFRWGNEFPNYDDILEHLNDATYEIRFEVTF